MIRSLAYLDQWERVARAPVDQGLHVVMDQGPLYRIIHIVDRLGLAEPDTGAPSWWSHQLETWGDLFHMVIYLDAPDEVLRQRIGGRGKPHRLEMAGPEDAGAELGRIRAWYEKALASLERRGTEVLRIDTSEMDSGAVGNLVAPGLSIGR